MKTKSLSLSFMVASVGVAGVLILSGCSANFGDAASTASQTTMHIKGVVHGGQQPLNGAHIYMYAASTTAYGGSGIAASASNASTSLLTAATGNPADGNGSFYVATDVYGNFDINGAFACTPNSQVYLYSIGGDPQVNGVGTPSGANLAATMMAVVGNCASATPSAAFPNVTFVTMNEISTAVTAFALAGFATDPLHIGAPSAVAGHTLSGTGIANAFSTALNIVNQASGLPNATFPANSNVTVPVTRINTVADILAACVNSTGAGTAGCSTLFSNTTYATTPADTATAAINFAQNPNGNMAALLALPTSTSPFQPFFSSANDLSLTLNYTGGGLDFPEQVAIDSAGNAWVANGGGSVTEISSTGGFLSGTTGYTDGTLSTPIGIAIDTSGNVWVANNSGNSVTELSSARTFLNNYTSGGLDESTGIAIDSAGNAWVANQNTHTVTEISSTGTATGYSGGGLNNPVGIAIDGSGNAWVANFGAGSGVSPVSEFSSTGTALSGVQGYLVGGLNVPLAIAIDSAGNAWVCDSGSNGVTELSGTGAPLSGVNGYFGGGLSQPDAIAIDGAGNAWLANTHTYSVTKFSSTGAIVSGSGFYTGGGLDLPLGIAIDGSGNVWVTNALGNSMTEIIGVGIPVITPIAAGLPVTPTPDGSSKLGTRP